jgi:replication factor A1
MSKQRTAAADTDNNTKPVQEPIVLKKPVFVTIDKLSPGSHGHNLYARVIEVKPVLDKTSRDGSKVNIHEALIADSTGRILFTIRNEQVGLVKADSNIIVRNAKIEMFKNHMRLAVDKWGLIEQNNTATNNISKEQVNKGNNLSDTEYELVNVE